MRVLFLFHVLCVFEHFLCDVLPRYRPVSTEEQGPPTNVEVNRRLCAMHDVSNHQGVHEYEGGRDPPLGPQYFRRVGCLVRLSR